VTIELGEGVLHRSPHDAQSVPGMPGMVFESAGPHRHAVNVGFHDSQMRQRAALIQTGWDGEQPGPYLSDDLVFRLIRCGAKLVGVDFDEVEEPARSNLLAANIMVVERLRNLAAAPRVGFFFIATPLSEVAAGATRVRAFLETYE
jgi:kynurenine formamidase